MLVTKNLVSDNSGHAHTRSTALTWPVSGTRWAVRRMRDQAHALDSNTPPTNSSRVARPVRRHEAWQLRDDMIPITNDRQLELIEEDVMASLAVSGRVRLQRIASLGRRDDSIGTEMSRSLRRVVRRRCPSPTINRISLEFEHNGPECAQAQIAVSRRAHAINAAKVMRWWECDCEAESGERFRHSCRDG